MLANPGRRTLDLISALDTVHNYYERRVIEATLDLSERAVADRDFLADVACVALNHLPPRYIRHDVDMTFFMSPQEQAEMVDKINRAVTNAIDYVQSREQAAPEETSSTDQPTAKAKSTSKPKKSNKK
ncbi:MAG TPA: late competence development ComFB family protein [Cellvibrionaceae bacterium]